MPKNPSADLPHSQDGDDSLDARTPEGVLPAERLADVADSSDASDEIEIASSPNPADEKIPSADPADQIPVPVAMSAAEIEKRAETVEAVRAERDLEPRTDV